MHVQQHVGLSVLHTFSDTETKRKRKDMQMSIKALEDDVHFFSIKNRANGLFHMKITFNGC